MDVREDTVSKIVVYKLDRISRNLLDFTSMYQEFENHKVEFCSVSEVFDTSTATGRSMLKISMVFAEMERETIQMRVKDNYYQRVRTDGRWAGGPAPYGFKNARTADKNGLIIPVVITVYADRSFSFITKTPPAPVLIKKACGIDSGSDKPNKNKVAKITKEQVRKIAETKMPDLNAANVEAAMSMIAGTARSMGVVVED